MAKSNVYVFLSLLWLIVFTNKSLVIGTEELKSIDSSSALPKPDCAEEQNGCKDRIVVVNITTENDPFAEWQSCFTSSFRIVKRDAICDEEVVCVNLTPCDLKCETHYICQDLTECVLRSTVCNKYSCDGCPEDHEWTNGVGFKCKRNGEDCVLPQQLVHDDIPDCDGGTDLCFGAKYQLNATSRNTAQNRENLKKEKCFMCLDDAMVIPLSRVCDGIFDCYDLTDECLCEEDRPDICDKIITYDTEIKKYNDSTKNESMSLECEVGQVLCESGMCIPREFVCDGIRDCNEDERYEYCSGTMDCADAFGYEKSCRCSGLAGCSVLMGTACDGIGDCNPPMEQKFHFPRDECMATCTKEESNFTCKHAFYFSSGTSLQQIPCQLPKNTNSSEKLVYVENIEVCNGKANCPLGEDEMECADRFKCDSKQDGYISIERKKTCDGVEDCKDGSDETKYLCNNTRFHCPALGGTKMNIDRKFVCDYNIACDDASDEKSCTDGRFYCENGDPLFVKERKTFDGYGDCSDWSDECPIADKSTNDSFSSRYELIANPILRALVWIMGLLSICGNATVLYREIRRTQVKKKLSANVMANKLLVINLAASDIIMGVYLLALGIASLTMQGQYCSRDLVWRSSGACIALGVMSVISSESSVITMVLLTGCRLYAIFQPFKSSNKPQKRTVYLMMFLAWTVSLMLALIPLSSQLSSTFVTYAQFDYSPYSRNAYMPLDNARELFSRLLTFDKDPNVTVSDNLQTEKISWEEMETLSNEYFVQTNLKIVKKFGYYSVNSVCIPNFFASRSDRAWGFSFFINLFNFVSFTFVATAYAAIYIRSRKQAKLRATTLHVEDKGSKVMQRKILRLIITDFCCWIPICIMAFSKLGDVYVSNMAYVVAAIVLLPINSALNPILYSDLPDALYKKITECFRVTKQRSVSSKVNSSSGRVQITNITHVSNNATSSKESRRSETNF